jgi:integrase
VNIQELQKRLEQYIGVRSALGFKDKGLKSILQDFLRYVTEKRPCGQITSNLAVDWATETPVARATGLAGPARRLIAVRGFLSHLRASHPDVQVPDNRLLAAARSRRPYLYSPSEIDNLLKAASSIGPRGTLRPHTYETLLGLLTCTGIRIGEAIRLKFNDVELQGNMPLLRIRETKFGKSRIVPLHPTAAERLRCYVQLRANLGYSKRSDAFFVSERGGHLYYGCLVQWFIRATRHLDMFPTPGIRTPTLHGLRHYFAIERLTSWCRQGLCIEDLAPQLSVYLGHAKPQHSYWYLTATRELLLAAGGSFELYSSKGACP